MRRVLATTGLVLTVICSLCACADSAPDVPASSPPSSAVTTAADDGVILEGKPLLVTPSPASFDGTVVEVADGVSMTIPSVMGDLKDWGPNRVKAVYHTTAEDLGMIDVDTATFDFDTVNLQARSEWQAYAKDDASPSELVQVSWPGAVDAYAFTWSQSADLSVFEPGLSGSVQVDGAALLLRTESGQDVYLAAYAAAGELNGNPAVAALNSVTLTR